MKKIICFILPVLLILSCTSPGDFKYSPFETPEGDIITVFSAASDMRGYTGSSYKYFRGVCDVIKAGGSGEFMISAGDIDPPSEVFETINEYIGEDYIWYPVAGNHETETPSDMEWLRSYNTDGNTLPAIVNTGPAGVEETMYSFDYSNVHFAVLNEYYDGLSDTGTDGDINSSIYNWLDNDLTASSKPVKFVIGHEPAYPLPDEESGRLRHEDDSLNSHETNRNSFWNLLASHSVKAYICGHTHNYSTEKTGGVWQIDTGHSRGTADTGARSTFMMFYIMSDNTVWYYTYRLNLSNLHYEFYKKGILD